MQLRLRGYLVDAECFFPDCLQSLKAVELVGADDDCRYILVKEYMVQINCYTLEDRKTVETDEALSMCGEAILLPSAEFDDAWDRSVDRPRLSLHG
jgi:hypothetical protein